MPCPEHPGFPEDIYVTSTPAALYRLMVGRGCDWIPLTEDFLGSAK